MDGDIDMAGADDGAVMEFDDMKKRLKVMEDEAAALIEMQAKVEKEMGSTQDPAAAAASQANREELDSRSVFVGNVRPLFCFKLVVACLSSFLLSGLFMYT
ncbi:Polyadenylate-binding protein [Actinidia chinensis var. chinensis]|uniref:Polyadenylate-binding protein n=1 Tax=Actinidia chinensis var. chinensis TaxID=1590841 RepID=A0A2R6RCA7_ACTCC|nr:Polyadenylate-binding protein [Actinidia chinensis var. chinensis]